MSFLEETESRQSGHNDGHSGLNVRPHAQQHRAIGHCRRILRRVIRRFRDLNESHECDGDDDGTEGEEDDKSEFVCPRDGELSQ